MHPKLTLNSDPAPPSASARSERSFYGSTARIPSPLSLDPGIDLANREIIPWGDGTGSPMDWNSSSMEPVVSSPASRLPEDRGYSSPSSASDETMCLLDHEEPEAVRARADVCAFACSDMQPPNSCIFPSSSDNNTSPRISLRKQIPGVRGHLGTVHLSSTANTDSSNRAVQSSRGCVEESSEKESENDSEHYQVDSNSAEANTETEDLPRRLFTTRELSEERVRLEEQSMMNAEAPCTPRSCAERYRDRMAYSDPGGSRNNKKPLSTRSLSPSSKRAMQFRFPSVSETDLGLVDASSLHSSTKGGNGLNNVFKMASGQQREARLLPSNSMRKAVATPNTPTMTVVGPNGDVSLLHTSSGSRDVRSSHNQETKNFLITDTNTTEPTRSAPAAPSPAAAPQQQQQQQASRSIMERIRRSIFDFRQLSSKSTEPK